MQYLVLFLLMLLLGGCQEQVPQTSTDADPRWVKTTAVLADSGPSISLTGILRARYETSQAFRISGQITKRYVDAGQVVRQGDILFTLDPSDLEEALAAARSELAAAQASLAVAEADLSRDRQLLEKNYVSRQAFERAELMVREARTRRDAANARMAERRNALDYATLRAEADGMLIAVSGEPGQVVGASQAVANLAHEGPREVEVNFPANVPPPETGNLLVDERRIELTRREVAGAVDPASRTLRARYRLEEPLEERGLGDVVNAHFMLDEKKSTASFYVPVAALDERGDGPQLWQIVDGKAQPMSIVPERMTREHVWVSGEALVEGQSVISLGTHLLKPGMAVRPLSEEDAP
ncbi:efflux RND transporter periplasmic adaptor subunit [Halomonas sp. LS-001]